MRLRKAGSDGEGVRGVARSVCGGILSIDGAAVSWWAQPFWLEGGMGRGFFGRVGGSVAVRIHPFVWVAFFGVSG